MKKSFPGLLRLWQIDIFFKNINFLFQIPISTPEVFCEKKFSEKFRKIHRKTPVPESLFNKEHLCWQFPFLLKKLIHEHKKTSFIIVVDCFMQEVNFESSFYPQ